MNIRQMRLLLRHNPFKSFTIHLADGRTLEVDNRDFLLLPQGERNTTVVYARPDGLFEWIYIRQIVSLSGEGLPPGEPATARGGEFE